LLAACRCQQLPAVETRQHQVEHAHVRMLVAQPCEARLAPRDDESVESARAQVERHRLRDHVVVLDDQHLRHDATIIAVPRAGEGCGSVTGW
jgi:hypothetical protein